MAVGTVPLGDHLEELVRPVGMSEVFPYHVAFSRLHIIHSKQLHHVRRHRHPHYEVMLVRRGKYLATINDQPISLGPGGVAMLKPGDWHEDMCPSPVAFLGLMFFVRPGPDPNMSANIFLPDTPPQAQVLANDTALHAIANRMQSENERGDPFTGALLDALTLEFVCCMARSVPRQWVHPRLLGNQPHLDFSKNLLGFFANNIGANLGLNQMARAMAMSERSLSARCRTGFSCSPTRLFVRFKMERARTLLMQTDRPIKEISRYLGFENPYHFSTVYKRVHGIAPTRDRFSP